MSEALPPAAAALAMNSLGLDENGNEEDESVSQLIVDNTGVNQHQQQQKIAPRNPSGDSGTDEGVSSKER